jgi:hypothetical protein
MEATEDVVVVRRDANVPDCFGTSPLRGVYAWWKIKRDLQAMAERLYGFPTHDLGGEG